MKKDQNLPNKNIYSNNSSGKPLPSNSNYTRNQSSFISNYRGRSPERGKTRNFSQNRYNRSNSQNNQNNYSRSNFNTTEFVSGSSSQSNPRNRHYSNNQLQNSSYNRNRNYSQNRNRSYSNNRNQNYPNNRSRNNSYNQTIRDQTIIIKTDHEIIHKIETQVTKIDTEIIPSHHTGIITVILILNIDREVAH